MNTKLCLEYSMIATFLLSLGTLYIMYRRHALRDFAFVGMFLATTVLDQGMSIPLLFFRKYLGISKVVDYDIYFYSTWFFFFAEYAVVLLVIYSAYKLAMRPFDGLQRIGKLVFRWGFGASIIVSFGLVMGDHIGPGFMGQIFLFSFIPQIERVIGILALCMLLFVTFAIRYLGLTYRNRIFGVNLGFGAWAATKLLVSVLIPTNKVLLVYDPIYLWGNLGCLLTVGIWSAYFVFPEPERKLTILPTTSPLFFWNRISEVLAGRAMQSTAEMLAPAELQVLSITSRTTKSRTQRKFAESSIAPASKVQSITSQRPQ